MRAQNYVLLCSKQIRCVLLIIIQLSQSNTYIRTYTYTDIFSNYVTVLNYRVSEIVYSRVCQDFRFVQVLLTIYMQMGVWKASAILWFYITTQKLQAYLCNYYV